MRLRIPNAAHLNAALPVAALRGGAIDETRHGTLPAALRNRHRS